MDENLDSGAETEGSSIDIESASNDLAASMFPEGDFSASDDSASDEGEDLDLQNSDDQTGDVKAVTVKPDVASPTEADSSEPTAKAAPKTWPKEMHEHWAKTPPEVQAYWETREKQMLDGIEGYKADAGLGKTVKDIISPHMPRITALGLDAPRAIQTLLQADYMLSTSPPSQKAQYFQSLAKQYGVDLGQLGAATEEGQQANKPSPEFIQLQDKLHNLEQVITSGNQQALEQARIKIAADVSTFAADPAHLYFDEVADDIITMLKTGASLDDAYEKAVWANPVTRQKEMLRAQTEQAASAKEKAIAEVAAAKAAKAANIRSRDTQRTPTEKNGATMRNLNSVMAETMHEIKAKTH